MDPSSQPAGNDQNNSGASGSGSNSTQVYCNSTWVRYIHKPKGTQVEATHFCYQCEKFYLCPDCLEDHKDEFAAHKTSSNVRQAEEERERLQLYGKPIRAPAASDIITKRLVYGLDEERSLYVVGNHSFVQPGRRAPMITLLGKSGVGKSTIACQLIQGKEAMEGFIPIVAELGKTSTTMGVTYFKGEIGNQDKMEVDILDFEGLDGSEKTYMATLADKACDTLGKVTKYFKFDGLTKYTKRSEAVEAYLLPLAYMLADAVIMVLPQAGETKSLESLLKSISNMSEIQVQHAKNELPHLVVIFNKCEDEFHKRDLEREVASQVPNRFSSIKCYTLPDFKGSTPENSVNFFKRLTEIQENLRISLSFRVKKAETASRHDRPYRMGDMFKLIVPRLPGFIHQKEQPIMLHSLIPGESSDDWHLRFADDFNERFIKQMNIPALAKKELLKPLLLVARSMMVFRMCSYQLLAQPFRYSSQSPKARQFNEGMNSIIECIENRLPCSATTTYFAVKTYNLNCGSLRGHHGKQHRSEGKCLKKFVPFFKTLFTRQSGFKDYHHWPEQGQSGGDYVRHPHLLECHSAIGSLHSLKNDENTEKDHKINLQDESTNNTIVPADKNSDTDSLSEEADSQKSSNRSSTRGIEVDSASEVGSAVDLSSVDYEMDSNTSPPDIFSDNSYELLQEQVKYYLSKSARIDQLQEITLDRLRRLPEKADFMDFMSSQKQIFQIASTQTSSAQSSSPLDQPSNQFFQNCCSLCLTQDNLQKIQCEKNHQACGNCTKVTSRLEICWICGFYGKKSSQSDPRRNPTQSSSKAPTFSFVKTK
eukprot:TRINITY_DN1_c0_g1_i2.p1 TRINITY_DN1_c0_g1~~TRINITY_DN1_c0_g1_i2.p1  ORF type:complete len:820 (+),score=101.90 TRINITY_DN1_c0_g1_i2:60-2519(+)